MKKIFAILSLFTIATLLGYQLPMVHADTSVSLLPNSWILAANNGAAEAYQTVTPTVLQGKSYLQMTYDLQGLCLSGGDASAIIFDQNGWKYVSLAKYGKNCYSGQQTVNIPLSDFKDISSGIPLDTTLPVGKFHVRFWSDKQFSITITSAVVNNSQNGVIAQPSPTPTSIQATPTIVQVSPTNTPTPITTSSTWGIQSIDAMKDTKDAVCGQRDDTWINHFLDKAKELGANYVAISTPYENPSCGDSLAYTKRWVNAIRNHGMHVWHRHMPLPFEGIYNVAKSSGNNYLSLISSYIKNNPDLFQSGDIFSPIPEPQNGGIQGITYCASSICQFSSASDFNKWLRDAITTANNAFTAIGKQGMKVGYYGFDGFVAWGDNNPDWHGILEDQTVQMMGNITIDHYPELVGETMDQGLTALQAKYPNTPIVIGEWGTVDNKNVVQEVQNSMGAAKAHHVVGFNYWQFGPEGSGEQLINDDFSSRIQFPTVQSFYKPQ